MKIQILVLLTISLSTECFGQTDTIFSNNEKIACNVKEVTPDAIKYSFPEEDLTTTIYKNAIDKIVFKSGRVQTFSEITSYKKVEKVTDFDNVTITQVESEIKGLFKVGDVGSKAEGLTTLSNEEKIKERAYYKLKIQAAMQGANIVFLTYQRTEGNKMGGYNQLGSPAEASLSGVAYTNKLPAFKDFEKVIFEKRDFIATKKTKLWSIADDLSVTEIRRKFKINNIINENGLIIVEGHLEGESKYSRFRVVTFTSESFNIFYKDKSTVYNIKVDL